MRSAGDEKYLDLASSGSLSSEQDTDRPGRSVESAGTPRRSSVQQTDWHHLEERRFVTRVAAALEDVVRKGHVPAILIAAPPKTLADLRRALHANVNAKIVAEVGKDLTKHPAGEIEAHLPGDGSTVALAGRSFAVGLSCSKDFKSLRPVGGASARESPIFPRRLTQN